MQFADLYNYIIYPLLFILPAYIANGAPVLFGGGAPLDMRKRFRRRRIFGDNKTIRGTAFMMVGAVVIGLIEYPFLHFMVYISILLGIGTIVGDLLGSFIKRQMRMNPGRSLPIMDQYGFFIFAILFSLPLGHTPDVIGIIFLVILTGVAHILTNRGAHLLRLKSGPW